MKLRFLVLPFVLGVAVLTGACSEPESDVDAGGDVDIEETEPLEGEEDDEVEVEGD